ncbi:hypothetical protein KHP60_12300 [Microvirga sp. 3-52]|uniref:hypothetical protein n=1 Tax=Microvirga sp. 3-52 TaxID=2792425 RepID=UPI001ACA55FC|nr:hypothetical protein [Microvirga sp. 3-52]MBO1905791.1 hypothetical protein [Microvirga sp. 3-52]MBS7453113.1 hypothetical protein [Microvirga sp. 3-52]
MTRRSIFVLLVSVGYIAAMRGPAVITLLPFLIAAATLAVASAQINFIRTALPELVLLALLVALGAELVLRGGPILMRRIGD